MQHFHWTQLLALTLAAVTFSGCQETPDSAAPAPPAADPHAHAHPTEGPHHGSLVELGNEEYHAEVVHEESGGVTIYILDGSATQPVAIDATELAVNALHQGSPQQFTLQAAPDTADAQGLSSRFTSDDAALGEVLDAQDSKPRLVVKIGTRTYRGEIHHSHDHDHAH